MADVLDSGIRFLSLDAPSSLEKIIDRSTGRLIVMGNVPTTLFARGKREEMEQAIRNCIQTAAEGSGYILASGCEIPLDSTEDRVAHFFGYGRKYGREFMAKLREQKPELFQD
jgi:uroporphyrinogen decarboxylase